MSSQFRQAFSKIETLLERDFPTMNAPGVAIGLTNREELLGIKTYGYADPSGSIPVHPDTLFEIGSISKSFACIIILQLHERGIINIHEPITAYLPWFKVNTAYQPFALHHLMSHTAAIPIGTEQAMSAACAAWDLQGVEATAPPGTFFHYSNDGYKLLGFVLQELLGRSYADILEAKILSPLGMTSTEAAITQAARPRIAVGYEAYYDDRPLPPGGLLTPAAWIESDTADGSIVSTAADMSAYLRVLLNRGKGLLAEESFNKMVSPVIPTGDDIHGEYYGYGLTIQEIDGCPAIGHGGGMVGYRSMMLADLTDGVGFIILMNGPAEHEGFVRYTLRLLRAAAQREALPPLPPINNPIKVINAGDYAGTYKAGTKTFTLSVSGEQLLLDHLGEQVILQRWAKDSFYVPHPAFDRFLLRFDRDDGEVVDAFHGFDWFTRGPDKRSQISDTPRSWNAYPGYYRSHNPWLTNFRVVLRKGALILVFPDGEEQPLSPLGGELFRLGEVILSPERLRFGPVLNGKAISANLSGGEYCRMFTS
jgi:D-alanyl-D-alanine carboxypeptidase